MLRQVFIVPSAQTAVAFLKWAFSTSSENPEDYRQAFASIAGNYVPFEAKVNHSFDLKKHGKVQITLKPEQSMPHHSYLAGDHYYPGEFSIHPSNTLCAMPLSSIRLGEGCPDNFISFYRYEKKKNKHIVQVIKLEGFRQTEAGQERRKEKLMGESFEFELSDQEVWDAQAVAGRTLLKVSTGVFESLKDRVILHNEYQDKSSFSTDYNALHFGPLHIVCVNNTEEENDDDFVSNYFKGDYHPYATLEIMLQTAELKSFVDEICMSGKRYISITGATTSAAFLSPKNQGDNYQSEVYLQALVAFGEHLASHWKSLEAKGFAGVAHAAMAGDGAALCSISADIEITKAFAHKWAEIYGKDVCQAPVIGVKDSNNDVIGLVSKGWFGNYVIALTADAAHGYANDIKEDILLGLAERNGAMFVFAGAFTVGANVLRALMGENPVPITVIASVNGVKNCLSGGHGLLNVAGAAGQVKMIHSLAVRQLYCKGVGEHQRKVATMLLLYLIGRVHSLDKKDIADIDLDAFCSEFSSLSVYQGVLNRFDGWEQYYADMIKTAIDVGVLHDPMKQVTVIDRDGVAHQGESLLTSVKEVPQYLGFVAGDTNEEALTGYMSDVMLQISQSIPTTETRERFTLFPVETNALPKASFDVTECKP